MNTNQLLHFFENKSKEEIMASVHLYLLQNRMDNMVEEFQNKFNGLQNIHSCKLLAIHTIKKAESSKSFPLRPVVSALSAHDTDPNFPQWQDPELISTLPPPPLNPPEPKSAQKIPPPAPSGYSIIFRRR